MDPRPCPFAAKLTADQAEKVRQLRARGLSLAEIAGRFGIARSSVSAIVKYEAHEPPGTLRVALPEFERAPYHRDRRGRGGPGRTARRRPSHRGAPKPGLVTDRRRRACERTDDGGTSVTSSKLPTAVPLPPSASEYRRARRLAPRHEGDDRVPRVSRPTLALGPEHRRLHGVP